MRILNRFKRSIAKRVFRLLPDALRKDLLVYVGVNRGIGLDHHQASYKRVIAIEADPNLAAFLREKYRNVPRVEIHNFAVSDEDGEIDFFVTSNDGKSSSLLPLDHEHPLVRTLELTEAVPVRVRSRPLESFLEEQGVGKISTYVSDIEEFDLTALKTLGKYISDKKIELIQVEVRSDEYTSFRVGSPDNRISSVKAFLGGFYALAGTGMGHLGINRYLPEDQQTEYFDALFVPEST